MAPPPGWEEMSAEHFPLLFFGVPGQQEREGESPSLSNPGGAHLLIVWDAFGNHYTFFICLFTPALYTEVTG